MEIGGAILKGYAWNVIVKWFTRALGLINTIIIVRILSPFDLGVMALSTFVIMFFLAMAQMGGRDYIFKTPNITEAEISSVWSLQLLINSLIALAIFIFSPQISIFMARPELESVLKILCIIPIMNALQSPGLLIAEKQMDFSLSAKVLLFSKFVTVPVTIFLAFQLQNYWCLVFGTLSGSFCEVVLSYFFTRYKVSLTLKQIGQVWKTTRWIFISSVTGYLRAKLELVIVNSKFGAEGAGLYSTSAEFAHLPITEIVYPVTKPLTAGIAKNTDSKPLVFQQLMKYLSISYLILMPSVFGIYIIADLFVPIVMGDKWLDAIPVFKAISLMMLIFTSYGACRIFLMLYNDLKLVVLADISTVILVIFILGAEFIKSLAFFAELRFGIGVLYILFLLILIKKRHNVAIASYFQVLLTNLIYPIPMFLILSMFRSQLNLTNAVEFVVLVFFGAIIFTLTIYLILFKSSVNNFCMEFQRGFIQNIMSKIKR